MISSHKYEAQISLHNKAIDILGMKINAMRLLDEWQERLVAYNNGKYNDPVCLMWKRSELERKVDKYTKVIPRLNRHYASLAKQVCSVMAVVEAYDSKVQGLPPQRLISVQDDPWYGEEFSILR